MKLPYPKHLDKTDIIINITEGMAENGSPNIIFTYTGKCRFKEKAMRIRNEDGKLILLEGRVTIGTDICPSVPIIEGSVSIDGKEYLIYKSNRPRNPDGSVHHTVLELI